MLLLEQNYILHSKKKRKLLKKNAYYELCIEYSTQEKCVL